MQGLVTVFGGSGFVGSQIVRALAKTGARIRVAVRNPGRGYRLRMLGDVGQIEVAQANIRDGASVERALDGAQASVNAVGVLFESGHQTFGDLHAEGAALLARSAVAAGAERFVQISAIGADANGRAAYARSKAAGEIAVGKAAPFATILRPSIVFGADDQFFNRFAAMAGLAPALPLIGGGGTRFQPVFVGDVAEAVAKALDDPAAPGRTYELGGPGVYTFKGLMEIMLAEIGKSRVLAPIPFPIAGLMGRAGDVVAMTGFPPPITSDQVEMLKVDNVVAPGALGLAELGIAAQALEPIIGSYLYRYRKGGQYAELSAAAAAMPPR